MISWGCLPRGFLNQTTQQPEDTEPIQVGLEGNTICEIVSKETGEILLFMAQETRPLDIANIRNVRFCHRDFRNLDSLLGSWVREDMATKHMLTASREGLHYPLRTDMR